MRRPARRQAPPRPAEEPEFDEELAPTVLEDRARARSEGPDDAHAARDLAWFRCGALLSWVEKEARSAPR